MDQLTYCLLEVCSRPFLRAVTRPKAAVKHKRHMLHVLHVPSELWDYQL